MRAIIILIFLFVFCIYSVAELPSDWTERVKKYDDAHKENELSFTPILDIQGQIYEIYDPEDSSKNAIIYKRNIDGTKAKIAELTTRMITRFPHEYYRAYKVDNRIYIYCSYSSEAGFWRSITAIDETTGKNFTYMLGEDFFPNFAYIEDGHAFFAIVKNNFETELINVEPQGIGYNKSRYIDLVVIETKKNENVYKIIKVNNYDSDKIVFFSDIDNYKYIDNKTGKIYTKREVELYEAYYAWRTTFFALKDFNITREDLEKTIEIDYAYYNMALSNVDAALVDTGLNTQNFNIMSIEEFCDKLRKDTEAAERNSTIRSWEFYYDKK